MLLRRILIPVVIHIQIFQYFQNFVWIDGLLLIEWYALVYYYYLQGFEGQVIRKLDYLTATVNHLCDVVNLLVNRHTVEQIDDLENAFELPISTTGDMKVIEDELKSSEGRDKKKSLASSIFL